jgi:hypothetical protein
MLSHLDASCVQRANVYKLSYLSIVREEEHNAVNQQVMGRTYVMG